MEDSPFVRKRAQPLSPSILHYAVKFAAAGVLYNFEQHFLPRFPVGLLKSTRQIVWEVLLSPSRARYKFLRVPVTPTGAPTSRIPDNSYEGGRAGRASLGSGRLRSHSSSHKLCNEGYWLAGCLEQLWSSGFSQPGDYCCFPRWSD